MGASLLPPFLSLADCLKGLTPADDLVLIWISHMLHFLVAADPFVLQLFVWPLLKPKPPVEDRDDCRVAVA